MVSRADGSALRFTAPTEADFAPDLLVLQDEAPRRGAGVTVLGISITVGCLLTWASLAQVDVVAVADGRLVPQRLVQSVQAGDAGVVHELMVREGDRVRRSQLLLRLDRRLSLADQRAGERDVWLKRLTLQRIAAELAGTAVLSLDRLTTLPGTVKKDATLAPWQTEAAIQVLAQFYARRRSHADAQAEESYREQHALAELQAGLQTLHKLQATLPAYQRTAQAYGSLHLEGFVGELAASEKAREALEREQDLKAQAASVDALRAAAAQAARRIQAIRSDYLANLQSERLSVQAELTRSEQQADKSVVHAEFQDLRAPADGIVKDLAVTGPGAVLQAGSLLMTLVPVNDALQVDLLLKNDDAGFAAVGQRAKVKVLAYPFQRHGLIDAELSRISPDASEVRRDAAPAATNAQAGYRAMVSLSAASLRAFGLPLQPGMAVTVDIHQGTRTVMEYLLSPVRKAAHEAIRER